jgi:type I restriction enzyme, S subunit
MSIPKGWNLISLEEIATVQRGKFSVRPRNDPRYYGGTTPFVQTGDVASSNGRLDSYTQTLNEEGVKVSKVFPKGTILVTIAANIGDIALTQFEVAIPDSLVAINPNEKADKEWLFQYLITQKEVLDGMATQNAQKNINLQVLQPLQILVPPLREQCRIAEILGVWDESIDLLEKLIMAKHKLKQGLMQQLLTGAKRFKKLEESDWKKVLIENVADINPRKHPDNLGFIGEFVEMASVSESGHLEKVAQIDTKISTSGYTAFINGDTLIAKITPCFENGKGALVKGLQGIGFGSTEFFVLRAKPEIMPIYLYYLTRTYDFGIRGKAMMQGSGGQQRVPSDFIKQFALKLPSLSEQEKIAAVLSAADAEISTLEKQLAAYKQQKRGLMQQLLTGRTRILGLEDGQD